MTQILTHSQNLMNLSPSDVSLDAIHIDDIATALAKQCRFNGHCQGFYSVAEHSVLVSYLVPDSLALKGLLHDAAEAYLGDLVSPVRAVCPEYGEMEMAVLRRIHKALGVDTQNVTGREWLDIEEADQLARAIEFEALFKMAPTSLWLNRSRIFPAGVPEHLQPQCLDWQAARLHFIQRFDELRPVKGGY